MTATLKDTKETSNLVSRHLLLPEGIYFERQRANYIFLIYYAEDLLKMKSSCCKSSVSTDATFKRTCSTKVVEPSSSVEIEYADLKVQKFLEENVPETKI